MAKPRTLPPSQTHLPVSMFSLGLVLATLAYLCTAHSEIDAALALLILLAAAGLPNIVADLFYFHRYRESSAELSAHNKVTATAVTRKWAGLAITLGFYALLYTIFPEYDRYENIWPLMGGTAAALLLLAAPFYFAWCLKRLDHVWDGYDEMGELARLHIRGRDWPMIGRHMRDWLVKAYFLPMMLYLTHGPITKLLHTYWHYGDLLTLFNFVVTILWLIDALFSSLGYICTFRPLNAHIRSSDPTWFGWTVTLACYAPFSLLIMSQYLVYQNGPTWSDWSAGHPWLMILWGTAILISIGIMAWTKVCFGIRFSNLTYRGLIASGPYRFTKHPSYVFKNLSKWLIFMPLLTDIWQVLGLLGFNLLYYLRALSEERHLSNYPEYVEYALAMNERSIFRGLTKFLPFLKYEVPKNPPQT